jgi:histidinol-phosphate aminotransferase
MTGPTSPTRAHGGPDARGRAAWDFSTNANAAGPCPIALDAVYEADPRHYPDPEYHHLRERLAQWHGVARERILIAASASEFIQRITAVGARLAPGAVALPEHAYGDYAAAALACGRRVLRHRDASATLSWHCDPSSPHGRHAPPSASAADATFAVLDAVYAPLRLEGSSAWDTEARNRVFELHSPNKALGLTGIRGAYAIAPETCDEEVLQALAACAPSWPLGAHAVAMLGIWASAATQHWLAQSRNTLRAWKAAQIDMLRAPGAEVAHSVTNFFCVQLPAGCTVAGLRECGIAVRDTASFGLAGWVRLSVQSLDAQAALAAALYRGRAYGHAR